MSNFICPTCGFNNIDCDKAGYKTDREIELEKKLILANKAFKSIIDYSPACYNTQDCPLKSGCGFDSGCGHCAYTIAHQALEEIKK